MVSVKEIPGAMGLSKDQLLDMFYKDAPDANHRRAGAAAEPHGQGTLRHQR